MIVVIDLNSENQQKMPPRSTFLTDCAIQCKNSDDENKSSSDDDDSRLYNNLRGRFKMVTKSKVKYWNNMENGAYIALGYDPIEFKSNSFYRRYKRTIACDMACPLSAAKNHSKLLASFFATPSPRLNARATVYCAKLCPFCAAFQQ